MNPDSIISLTEANNMIKEWFALVMLHRCREKSATLESLRHPKKRDLPVSAENLSIDSEAGCQGLVK